jgi:hypothetical protein
MKLFVVPAVAIFAFSFVLVPAVQASPYNPRLKDALVLEMKASLESGRHDFYKIESSTPLDMVRAYIVKKYEGDEDLSAQYVFKDEARDLEEDVEVAGVLDREVALKVIDANLSDESPLRSKILENFDRLAAMEGVRLGFDAFAQNGCAAPTPFVLVIDTRGGEIDGIDLYPCAE